MTGIIVRTAGPLTTIQDLGRFGSQALGVPPSGAADRDALEIANLLVGNDRGAACLECTLRGPELECAGPAILSVCGADMAPAINGKSVPMWTTLFADSGDVLSLGTAVAGLRGYIAFAGGLDVPEVLGSRSTYVRAGFGGFEGRALRDGDRLRLGRFSGDKPAPCGVPEAERPVYADTVVVRAIPSHEIGRFEPESVARFFEETYTVSLKSDRMGCRLEGPPLAHTRGADIISSGVQTGTVQVPGDGMPIVLLADRQTTGGYTRIAQVIQADLPLLGQVRPGGRVRFLRTAPEDAREAWRRRDSAIAARVKPLGIGPPPPEIPCERGAGRRRFRVTVNGSVYDVEISGL